MSRTVLAVSCLLMAGCMQATDDTPAATAPVEAGPHMGDWWRVHVHDEVAQDEYNVTLVVDAVDPMMFGTASARPRLLLVPGPPIGHVDDTTLGWRFMGERFEPLQLPAEPGATWTTRLQGTELRGEITSIRDDLVKAELHGSANDIYVTYNASVGMITAFENEGWVRFEVVDHGVGWSRDAWVPEYEHVMNHGRLTGGVNPAASGMHGPQESIEVPSADGIVGISVVASLVDAPGAYSQCVTTPWDDEHCVQAWPGSGSQGLWHDHRDPKGTWQMESIVAGPGVAYTQAVAYTT